RLNLLLLTGLLLSPLLWIVRLPLTKLLHTIPKQRLIVDVLCEQLRTRHTSVGIDEDQTEVFSGDRVFVGAPDKSQTIGRHQLLDGRRIHAKPALILLNGAGVLLAAKNQFLF